LQKNNSASGGRTSKTTNGFKLFYISEAVLCITQPTKPNFTVLTGLYNKMIDFSYSNWINQDKDESLNFV
jgi:hypothetical protein